MEIGNAELPSDKTLRDILPQYELYKYAHNGLPEYLSYELAQANKRIKELELKNQTLAREKGDMRIHIQNLKRKLEVNNEDT